jgi:hypothetical protein
MNAPGSILRPILREHIIFYTYRWLAWGVAGWALFVLHAGPGTAPHALWLFVFTGILNIISTAAAQSYVRTIVRRPSLLLLDVLLGVLLVWASEGNVLPFLPYALSALVLPGLLFTWYHALTIGLLFVALDLLAIAWWGASGMSAARILLPLVFVGACLLARSAMQWYQSYIPTSATPSTRMPWSASGARHTAPTRPALTKQSPAFLPGQMKQRVQTNSPVATMETTKKPESVEVRPASRHYNQEAQHSLQTNLSPGPDIDLTTALHNLASAFNRDNDVDLQLELAVSARQISHAKQIALIKLAQEALLNIQQHAQAHSAWLTLNYEPHQVMLIIQDDGVGLLDGTYQRPGLHALRAIRYRLMEMDGRLEVFEGANGGVTVCGILPLGDS